MQTFFRKLNAMHDVMDKPSQDVITFTLERLTPELADRYLLHNVKNRKVRRQVVSELCQIITNNEWQVVHQPIAFDSKGKLLDGQHRLLAIVKTGVSVWCYVARYSAEDTAMNLPIDRQTRRTLADILEQDKKTVQAVTAIIEVADGRERRIPSPGTVAKGIERLACELEVLRDKCGHQVKVRSAQSVRGAVLCCMVLSGDPHLVADQYRACLLLHFDECMPSVLSFVRYCDSFAGGGGAGRKELFLRALKAFDPVNFKKKTIRLSHTNADWEDAILKARAVLGRED